MLQYIDSIEDWLWLLLVMLPYNPKTPAILSKYDYSIEAAVRAVRNNDDDILSAEEHDRAEKTTAAQVHDIIGVCRENGVDIITLADKSYPALLMSIDNPPAVLFCKGSLSGLDDAFTLSVVGTRNATSYGYAVASALIRPLSALGAVIASGLAVGLDTAAHKACLESGGRTVGVCGCGILIDYPKGNMELKRQIAATGGAVISELLPYAQPFSGYFKHRNRIISGISLGTLVLEAGKGSGCLLTAAHAIEQGREVFAVPPHSILDEHFGGASLLIRDGATPVFNYLDIVNAYMNNNSSNRYFKNILNYTEENQES